MLPSLDRRGTGEIGAIGVTEPDVGSDSAGMQTTITYDEADGEYVTLSIHLTGLAHLRGSPWTGPSGQVEPTSRSMASIPQSWTAYVDSPDVPDGSKRYIPNASVAGTYIVYGISNPGVPGGA